MKKIILISLILFIVNGIQAQGIRFEQGLSWEQVKHKAKAEHKLIFMDCYATWCGPCKVMAKNVFPQKEVGDFFNAHFISVVVQMDHTPNDPEEVKKWYADAKAIQSKYAISAYPTYLFFSFGGEAVHRVLGSMEANKFVEKAKDALNPKKQYYAVANIYKEHLRDSAFLRNAFDVAFAQHDEKNAADIAEYYLDCLKTPFLKENVDIFLHSFPPSSSKVFQFLLHNAAKIDPIIDIDPSFPRKNYVENELSRIITDEQVLPLFNKDFVLNFKEIFNDLQGKYPELAHNDNGLPQWIEASFNRGVKITLSNIIYKDGASFADWDAITKKLSDRFVGYDVVRVIDNEKPGYYAYKKMWPECEKAALKLLDKYGDNLSAGQINGIVWSYLFMYSSDRTALLTALKWSKRSVDMVPGNTQFIDTYANLLYKTDNKDEALVWEKKAIEIAESSFGQYQLKDFQENLAKMQKGEITWASAPNK